MINVFLHPVAVGTGRSRFSWVHRERDQPRGTSCIQNKECPFIRYSRNTTDKGNQIYKGDKYIYPDINMNNITLNNYLKSSWDVDKLWISRLENILRNHFLNTRTVCHKQASGDGVSHSRWRRVLLSEGVPFSAVVENKFYMY